MIVGSALQMRCVSAGLIVRALKWPGTILLPRIITQTQTIRHLTYSRLPHSLRQAVGNNPRPLKSQVITL